MRRSPRPICARCGVGLSGALDAVLTCSSCRSRPLAFEAARSPWQYAGAARDAVQLFKYYHRWRIGRWLAREMAAFGSRTIPMDRIDVILPVPLHWLKRYLRGFNPAAQLAESVAAVLQKSYEPSLLRRCRWTATQTALNWPRRWRNVREAFLADATAVHGRTILLIDDVLTSGATAHACALALKGAGARRVYVLTAARTPLGFHHDGTGGTGYRARHRQDVSLAPRPSPLAPHT